MIMKFLYIQTRPKYLSNTKIRTTFGLVQHVAHFVRCLVVLVVICSLTSTTVEASNLLRAHSPYLYVGDAYPIIEYILSHSSENERIRVEKNLPSFLYDTDQGYRIVQFYSSRLEPVASRLRDSYIQLADATTQIVQENFTNVTLDAYAVCCTTVPSLCEKQGIDMNHRENVPVFMIYAPGSSDGKVLEKFNVSTILEAMNLTIDMHNIDASVRNVRIDLSELSQGGYVQMRTIAELKADIHLSLYTFMRDHVFMDHDEHENLVPLSTEKRNALKKYLLLIQKSIPSSWPVYSMVKGLMNSFMYICKNRAYLIAALDAHAPKITEFSHACQYDMSHVSGLTCGAWEMIHTVTVGIVERNKMALNSMDIETNTNYTSNHAVISNEEASSVIRDFVHYFGLGDDETERQQLVHQLDMCKDEGCLSTNNTSMAIMSQWIKLPLYFSKTHSDITLKKLQDMAKEKQKAMSTFQQHMIAMWPPKYACPQCWDAHNKWDTNIVYKYMQLEYTDLNEWSLSSPEIRQELLGTNSNIMLQRQLSSNSYKSKSKTSFSYNMVLLIQQIVVVISASGIVLYRVILFQQQKQQQATMLILPQTIRSKVTRNKSIKNSNMLSYVFDQKTS